MSGTTLATDKTGAPQRTDLHILGPVHHLWQSGAWKPAFRADDLLAYLFLAAMYLGEARQVNVDLEIEDTSLTLEVE